MPTAYATVRPMSCPTTATHRRPKRPIRRAPFTPAMITGAIALVILAVVLVAFYRFRVAQAWRWIYATGMVASLFLLVFVGVVQAFQKINFLNGLAPTQSELPFAIAQGATLAFFVDLGIVAAKRYRPEVMATRFQAIR